MSLLPSKPNLTTDAEPRVVGVDSEDADALMSALSSGTARRILAELHDEPAPPAELSQRADTTLQNTQYHLSNLEEAGAVEVIGTAYSEKGREMDVYAPADQPLVIFAGQEQQASGIRAALSRLLSGIGALLVGSLAVQQVFGDSLLGFSGLGASGGGEGGGYDAGSGDGTAPTESTATEPAAETAAGGSDGGGSVTATAEPTPQPDDDAATATSDGPGVFSTGESTESATQTVADTVAATSEPATQTPSAAPTPSPAPEPTAAETVQAASDGGIEVVGSLPPGLLFFLGGLTVLLVGLVLTTRM
ncbi:helix-turn-helix domain-containing protein [Halorarius litoreus]|uniref:helix-turn-helix domain-containing protein n=1 Tax=Halorarius litoreus TaxID=2962676 RepID=UPI0020CF2E8D|nr:helix-turn-helix domain-containing protein [Halorarius litoreus]